MTFYAHKKVLPSGEEQLQTVQEHLQGTAELAARFAQPFGAEKIARLAGMAHDLGKFSAGFQRRLLHNGAKVDHSTAGALECMKLQNYYAAFCVLGHHAGLPDLGVRGDMSGSATFWGRINRASEIEPYDAANNEVALENAEPPRFAQTDPLAASFFIRMLYSCLVDADFLDTERFMQEGRATPAYSFDALDHLLEQYTNKWFPPQGQLNQMRCEILNACRAAGTERPSGLFTLTVPTGGGKTISSLAFALKHSVKQRKRRIIYVIPYTSIIDQTVETFRNIFGEEFVLAHHAGIQYDVDDFGTHSSIQKAKATENWSMPIVVTTAVQFFESLYSNRSSKCRKLHSLADSVIIFDEAQMLPMPYLYPCIYGIAELVKNYGVTSVLCTATQPALAPIFKQFLPGEEITEICPEKLAKAPVFSRVQYKYSGMVTWEQLCKAMNGHKQALCIVNSRKNALRVFQGLCGEGVFHLSTLMYPAHRMQTLNEIRERLNTGACCKVIATSLIEAGVDVNFPAVFREKAGLDSIIQAGGRCNREGKRRPEESIVTVFAPENPAPSLFSMQISSTEMVMQEFEDFAGQKAIQMYFKELMGLRDPKTLDQKQILRRMRQGTFPFASVAADFHLIETQAKTVYIPLGEGAALLEALRQGERSKALYRRLTQYAVSIYPKHFDALYKAGAISLLDEESAVLEDLTLYSSACGLALEADEGQALFI